MNKVRNITKKITKTTQSFKEFGKIDFKWFFIGFLILIVICAVFLFFRMNPKNLRMYERFSDSNSQSIDSKLIDSEIANSLLPNKKFTLLYRASRDGFDSTVFNDKCSKKGPTLVVVKANDRIAGGFTPVSWNKEAGGFLKAPVGEAFLWGLDDQNNTTKYNNDANGTADYSIYSTISFGPIFGGGWDFSIANNANNNTESYSSPYTYSLPSDTTLFGSRNFRVQDYEVFQVDDPSIKIIPVDESKVFSKINVSDRILAGEYNRVDNDEFKLKDELPYWRMIIKVDAANYRNRWQSIVGNMKNNSGVGVRGWGLWVSASGKLHWSESGNTYDLNALGALENNVPYQIDITYENGIYNFKLTNLFTNFTKEENVKKITPLITDRGFVTIGGKFELDQSNELFKGSIHNIQVITDKNIEPPKYSLPLEGYLFPSPAPAPYYSPAQPPSFESPAPAPYYAPSCPPQTVCPVCPICPVCPVCEPCSSNVEIGPVAIPSVAQPTSVIVSSPPPPVIVSSPPPPPITVSPPPPTIKVSSPPPPIKKSPPPPVKKSATVKKKSPPPPVKKSSPKKW